MKAQQPAPQVQPQSLTGLAVEIQCLMTSGHILILFPQSDQYIKMDYATARRVAEGIIEATNKFPVDAGEVAP